MCTRSLVAGTHVARIGRISPAQDVHVRPGACRHWGRQVRAGLRAALGQGRTFVDVEQAGAPPQDRRMRWIGTTFDRWVVSWLHFPRWAAVVIVAGMLAACWVAVMVSGGTQRTLPHLYYVPI